MKGLYLRPRSGLSLEDAQDILEVKIQDCDWRKYLRGDIYLLSCDKWITTKYLRLGSENWFFGKDFKEVTVDDLVEVCI